MIDLDEWSRQLDEEPDRQLLADEKRQRELFEEYVLRKPDHRERRMELAKRFAAGAPVTGKGGLRRQLAAFDLAYFGRAYLPHYFVRRSPEFHEELDGLWTEAVLKGLDPEKDGGGVDKKAGNRRALAAPRGHAKSTTFTFKDDLHAILYGYKHYIIILSDSSDQAEGFLEDIRTELEDNGLIREDFGDLKGSKVWRSGVFVTSTDVKVEAIGSGKKIRGRRHRNWRPDLIVLDDIENDENVNTPEQRRKLSSWYYKAVSKAGDTYTDIMYIGTVLHYDSLLSNVLNNPGYRSKVYRAVESFAEEAGLWEEWERTYTNLFNDHHEEDARAFFECHREDMLRGTKVLWPEKFDYYELMCMRVIEGEASFNSEMQNDPIDPENADFLEEWFDYYEDEAVDFRDPRFLFVGANDPSLGKDSKADTSSIINLALDLSTGYMYVADASVERRKPDVIIRDILDMDARLKRDFGKGFYRFGVETVQFQYFFKTVLDQISREEGTYLPTAEINSNSNKMIRIRSLQPFVKNRWIKFNRRHKALIRQMTEFPMGRNDDAPDGLHMAVQTALEVRETAAKPEYTSVLARAFGRWRGAF